MGPTRKSSCCLGGWVISFHKLVSALESLLRPRVFFYIQTDAPGLVELSTIRLLPTSGCPEEPWPCLRTCAEIERMLLTSRKRFLFFLYIKVNFERLSQLLGSS